MGADGAKVLEPKAELDKRFLFYYLSSLNIESAGYSRHFKFLKENVVPVPPLPEQKRIAAILDKADAIRRKRQQAIQLADDFLRAVFLDMFGDPVTNPMGWEVKRLGDVIKLSSGNGLSAKEMDSGGCYPVYGGNGINGYHSEYMFEEPQLVIGRVGAYCGAIHITQPCAWVTDNALYIREYVQDVNVHYMAQLLDVSNLNQYAGKAAQPLVSGGRIYPLEMIFPPLQDQFKFEAIKTKYLESSKIVYSALLEIETMFGSLTQKAFSGQL
ncbi:type I restriction modification DNA specificity domain protein [Pseudomonas aeruginosa PAK]|nr:type I restriction modification DNA specificity domain protein [Pseudomonas aeruginosa PAK]